MKVGDKILITNPLEFSDSKLSYKGVVGTVLEIERAWKGVTPQYPYRVKAPGVPFIWCDGIPATELTEELC